VYRVRKPSYLTRGSPHPRRDSHRRRVPRANRTRPHPEPAIPVGHDAGKYREARHAPPYCAGLRAHLPASHLNPAQPPRGHPSNPSKGRAPRPSTTSPFPSHLLARRPSPIPSHPWRRRRPARRWRSSSSRPPCSPAPAPRAGSTSPASPPPTSARSRASLFFSPLPPALCFASLSSPGPLV
jgi:hypothetical protein